MTSATSDAGDPFFDAVRLLLLLDAAGGELTPQQASAHPEAVAIVRGKKRLLKLDFWLRYPDYLADELLNEYELSGERILLDIVTEIFDAEEPELRTISMLRYKFGAYDNLDMPMSVLTVAGLVVIDCYRDEHRVRQYDYFLTSDGRDVARSCVDDFPVLAWYGTRTRLVVALAHGTGMTGTALQKRQYLQRDYAGTGLGEEIGSIADRARERLAEMKARASVAR